LPAFLSFFFLFFSSSLVSCSYVFPFFLLDFFVSYTRESNAISDLLWPIGKKKKKIKTTKKNKKLMNQS